MTQRNPVFLANLIRNWCDNKPDLDVLTFVSIDEDGRFVHKVRTYQQLWDNGQRLANWLRDQGMKRGDAFAMVMLNHSEFVELMIASSVLGTVFVPIDPRMRGDKLKFMLDFAECKGAIAADGALPQVQAAWQNSPDKWLATLELEGGYSNLASVLESDKPQPELTVQSDDPDAPMQLLYTSGTTGDPKAILSSHSRYAIAGILQNLLGLTDEDRPYTGLSLTHANAQIASLGMILHSGMRGVISLKFTKSRIWDITREYGCTFFNLLGGMTTALYAEPAREDDRDNPVKTILSAGMPAEIWTEFSSRFGVQLIEFYGAAEGGLAFNHAGVGPVGSCGKVVPSMQVAILDEKGNPVGPGVAGEICFREADGSCPKLSYFKNPDATAKKLADGWLHMGDIGHMDENGWLFFHHRIGGGIRKNGQFISPAFTEKALAEIESVSDVFVYGHAVTPDLAPGEVDIVAAIVPVDADKFDVQKVFASCQRKLDASSVPDFIQIVKAIPKTASEKPQERFLKDAFAREPENVFSASK